MSLATLNSGSKKGMSENKIFLAALFIVIAFTAILVLLDQTPTDGKTIPNVDDITDFDVTDDVTESKDDVTDVDDLDNTVDVDVTDDVTDVDDLDNTVDVDTIDINDDVSDTEKADSSDVDISEVDVIDDVNDVEIDGVDVVSFDGDLFLDVGYSDLGRCGNSVNGKVQTFMLDLVLDGVWGAKSSDAFALSCNGADFVYPVSVHRKGGGFADPYSILNGTYRVAYKCGRTGEVFDYRKCKNLSLYLDASKTASEKPDVEVVDTVVEVIPTSNPYLDKFRGQGLRKADLDIHWLCPSCVPAVNRLVIGTEGVKSRSLSYKQDVCYVIYDPETVSLERVMEVAGAGGDLELISDTELV